jgi:hypothetical protein
MTTPASGPPIELAMDAHIERFRHPIASGFGVVFCEARAGAPACPCGGYALWWWGVG